MLNANYTLAELDRIARDLMASCRRGPFAWLRWYLSAAYRARVRTDVNLTVQHAALVGKPPQHS